MKKKIVSVVLAISLLAIAGCGSVASNTGTQVSEKSISESMAESQEGGSIEEETSSEEVSEDAVKSEMNEEEIADYKVDYKHEYANAEEKASIIVSLDGEEVWNYEVSTNEIAQLDRYTFLGNTKEKVYFLEKGNVKCMDIKNGELLWEVTDKYIGSGGSLIDENGNLYVCGYFGPFYMVISPDGEILAECTEAAEEDLYWGYEMELVGDNVRIYCESNEDAIVLVNREDYTYTVEY